MYDGGSFLNSGAITLARDKGTTAQLVVGGLSNSSAIAPGAVTASVVNFGDGDGELLFNHTALDYVFDADISGGLSGAGTVKQLGGRSILSQNSIGFTGVTEISGGSLQVNGMLGGSTSIMSGGVLEGVGTISSVNNAGVLAPGSGTGATHGELQNFATLTVAGDYIGAGGIVAIETELGLDASRTDRLVVEGDTGGDTQIAVVNRNGAGAQTTNGIKIVDVSGASNGAFSLIGDYVHEGEQAVVGGAYAYKLRKNGIIDPNDGDWYLRSQLLASEPEKPLFQAGVPVYEAYPQALLSLNRVATLEQRVGNRIWGRGSTNLDAESTSTRELRAAHSGAWGRIDGSRLENTPRISSSETKHDQSIFKLQTGYDAQLLDNEAGALIGGVFVHYTNGKTKTTSPHGDGELSTTGYGLGGTLTWYGHDGFYIDTQGQVTFYSSDLSSKLGNIGLVSGNDGFGYALSFEAGKHFSIDDSWSLTPQVQLTYSSVRFDGFTDAFDADVRLERGKSFEGRVGLSIDRMQSWLNDNGLVAEAKMYGIANLYYEFAGDTRVAVADTSFTSGKERLWGGIGIGGSYAWDDKKYTVFGEGLIKTSMSNFGDSNDLQLKVGMRVNW